MKFVCPSCDRLSELRTFRLDAGALFLKCDRCGNESRSDAVPAQATGTEQAAAVPSPSPHPVASVVPLRVVSAVTPRAGEDPFEPPDDCCPKCVSPRAPDGLSCPSCGLVFANYTPSATAPAPPIAERWRALIPKWSDPAAHDEVLKSAMVFGQLPQVGRLYRIQLARRPDDPLARRGRDEVIRLASAASSAMGGGNDELGAPSTKSLQTMLYWGFAAVVLLLLMLLLRSLRG